MNSKQILAGLALGAGLLGASIAPQIASAHGGKDHKDQKVTVSIDAKGFHPATIKVKPGQEVHLTFVSKGEGCANAFIIPALKQNVTLKKGEKKEIVFTPKKGQAIGFACKMGMFKGTVTAK